MKKIVKIGVIIILMHHYCHSQIIVKDKAIRLTEIMEKAVFTDTSYVYSNATILVDDLTAFNIDLNLSWRWRTRFELYKSPEDNTQPVEYKEKIVFDSLHRVIINSDLEFSNCKIKIEPETDYYPLLDGFVFKKLSINNLSSPLFTISNSKFTECLRLDCSIDHVVFNDVEFDGGLKIILNQPNSKVYLSWLKFTNFKYNGLFYGPVSSSELDSRCGGLTIRSKYDQDHIQINDSYILLDESRQLSINVPKTNEFHLTKDSITCPVIFNDLIIENRLWIDQTTFSSGIHMSNLIFSDKVNHIFWKEFAGRKLTLGEPSDSILVRHESQYKLLIRQYKKLHSIFTDNGDIESANGCYVEMKELETLRLAAIYQDEGGYYNFLKLGLNKLIRSYANYGTDPILAIRISTYVLLVFSFLYFFFPSEWDKLSRTELLTKLRATEVSRVQRAFTFSKSIVFHFVNSFALSLNSFITLGFGAIPTTGFPRYLCIIEGCIGWFLLSIFTVSLLNQLMI